MKPLWLFILIPGLAFSVSIEEDYRKVFGSDYSRAEEWLTTHENRIKQYADLYKLPASELKAIIFPELIRYNRVFDAIEIESLKYLYVSEGKSYADFSVGYFQMKPSFAEMVEQEAVEKLDRDFLNRTGIGLWGRSPDIETARKERVKRITSIDGQLVYLCAFYKLCQQKFAGRDFASATGRIRFFATCYNAGYNLSDTALLNFQLKKQFYSCNYSAVSAYYYENHN